ncbi:MAG: quinolinate synthase NadA [Syntrophales bacterium]|jgi:quinolinate synthase|nr:quinolinate synthase NadA [Syntrophales bacterium]
MGIIETQERIRRLLDDNNAILLAHYYQRDEIQDIADILGDSLALSMEAADTVADVIVFAGVRFMAESASILSPDKTVLLPRLDAGCPLADKITVEELRKAKAEHPGAKVVTYVNSSAEIKAHSDICCTSANAVRIVDSLDADTVLMVPDGNLARYTARFTEKKIIPWKGFCYVHNNLLVDEIQKVKDTHPGAPVAIHPECRPEVVEMADFVGSTGGILKFARETDAQEVIIGTEQGIMHQLKKESPGKTFIPASDHLICLDMKRMTLDDILKALLEMEHMIRVPEEIRAPASLALSRMLEASR